MNAQYRYQVLQQRGIYRLTSIAQGYRNQIGRQNTQIEELQATVTAKEEIITQRDETIQHREDQIVESDALIAQRNTVIDFLQEQVHELNLNLGQAIDHINMLHEQLVQPIVDESESEEEEEEEPEEVEGVSEIDSEHGDPALSPHHSSSGSQSSVGNLDDF
jgi:chromosome segregation ATPase